MNTKSMVIFFLSAILLLMPVDVVAGELDIKKVHIVDEPYPPFTLGELGGPVKGGIAVEIVQELFSRLGVEVEFELVPWKRVLKMVEVGHADGTNLLLRDDDRERYLVFTDTVLEVRELIYYRPDRISAFKWETFNDLKDYTIGLVDGYAYGGDFLKAVDRFGLTVEYSESSALGIQKLLAGRIDLIIENEPVIKTLIADNKAWKGIIKAASKPLSTIKFHLSFSKRSPWMKRLPDVNRAIAEMKQDGSIDRIVNGTH